MPLPLCCPFPQVPRLRTAVLGMGLLPASLPPTVERLGVVGEPSEPALSQAYAGLQALLPQVRVQAGQDGVNNAVHARLVLSSCPGAVLA